MNELQNAETRLEVPRAASPACAGRPAPSRRAFVGAALELAASALALAGCASSGGGAGSSDTGSASASTAATAPIRDADAEDPQAGERPEARAVTPADLDALPAAAGVTACALAGAEPPELPVASSDAIGQALDRVRAWGEAGGALVNLATGRGICFNLDATVYGASSFKLPYALYVCEEQIDTGAVALGTPIAVFPPGASIPVDASSSWATQATHPVAEVIEAAVVRSDNDAFGILRNNFDSQGFDAWATRIGATDCLYRADSWYPWYSARSSLKLWCEAWNYFAAGSETASWLSGLAARTETSFLRDALGGTGAAVRDKAGWITASDPSLCAVADAGIIEAEGTCYLISLMTGMPDGAETRALIGALASALFEARATLA